jgi:hypothetical protein
MASFCISELPDNFICKPAYTMLWYESNDYFT